MIKDMHIFLKKTLSKTIYIEKLGVTIRPLTIEEKNKILLKYDNLFFSKRAKRNILKYLSLHKPDGSFNSKAYQSLSAEQFDAGFIYNKLKEDSKKFNKNIIKKQLNKLALIEFDERINDYTEDDLNYLLFTQIIKVLLFQKFNISLSDLKNLVIFAKDFSIFSEKLITFNSTILNYISPECSEIVSELDLDECDFLMLKNFINSLTKDRIRDFIIIIDNLFLKSNSIDNTLLNYISSIERMLVKYEKDYDIGKQIVLKFGLCITDNNLEDIDEHLKKIKYCYEIRSCIIHGNDNDLLNAPKKYLGLNKKDLKTFIGIDKHYKTRFIYIYFATNYLEKNMNLLLKEWMKNSKRIEFLKKN